MGPGPLARVSGISRFPDFRLGDPGTGIGVEAGNDSAEGELPEVAGERSAPSCDLLTRAGDKRCGIISPVGPPKCLSHPTNSALAQHALWEDLVLESVGPHGEDLLRKSALPAKPNPWTPLPAWYKHPPCRLRHKRSAHSLFHRLRTNENRSSEWFASARCCSISCVTIEL